MVDFCDWKVCAFPHRNLVVKTMTMMKSIMMMIKKCIQICIGNGNGNGNGNDNDNDNYIYYCFSNGHCKINSIKWRQYLMVIMSMLMLMTMTMMILTTMLPTMTIMMMTIIAITIITMMTLRLMRSSQFLLQ